MTRLPIWALVPVFMVLAACSGQTTIPAATPTSIADEHHPDAFTSGSVGIHPGDHDANSTTLDKIENLLFED